MSEAGAIELKSIRRQAAALVKQVAESRWKGLLDIPVTGENRPRLSTTLEDLAVQVSECRRCGLHATRLNTVFGEGDTATGIMFVGEAPGAEEDRQGRPFVGAAGQLLDRIIAAMGLRRNQVFIANILKCRPPGNRNPGTAEVTACRPFLEAQLEIIKPRVICALGKFAAQFLAGSSEPISRLRGRFHDFRGIPVMPTFHPAYLLRTPADKKLTWEDIQQVMALCGLPAAGDDR